jgi:hypothetical protein
MLHEVEAPINLFLNIIPWVVFLTLVSPGHQSFGCCLFQQQFLFLFFLWRIDMIFLLYMHVILEHFHCPCSWSQVWARMLDDPRRPQSPFCLFSRRPRALSPHCLWKEPLLSLEYVNSFRVLYSHHLQIAATNLRKNVASSLVTNSKDPN